MDAPFLYLVRFWVNPEGAKAVLHWLDGGHMRDVVGQPGFLWVRRVRLDQNAPERMAWLYDDLWRGIACGAAALLRWAGAGAVCTRTQAVRALPAHGAQLGHRRCCGAIRPGARTGKTRSAVAQNEPPPKR